MKKTRNSTAEGKTHPKSLADVLASSPKLPTHEWRACFDRKPGRVLTGHLRRWQLQQAKAKFSELFDRAFDEGPQVVTRRNKSAVVVLTEEQFRTLAQGPQGRQPNMLEVLRKCPPGPDLKLPPRNDNVLNQPAVFE